MRNKLEIKTLRTLSSKASMLKCKTCDTKECFIKKYCSSKWCSLIDKQRTSTLYNKGSHILHQGAHAGGVFFIYSGKAKIFNSGINGNTQITRLAKSGDLVGRSGYGGGQLTYSKSAVALEDSIICFVEKDNFLLTLKENPDLTFNMMLFYARGLNRTEMRLNNMVAMKANEKVADALLFIKRSFSTENIHLTRNDIGSIAGTSPEEVSRILSGFERNKLIEKSIKNIQILDEESLEKIANPREELEYYDQ